MKKLLALAVLPAMFMASCSLSYGLKGTATLPLEDTYSCIVGQLSSMGYDIVAEDRGTGSVKATQSTRMPKSPVISAFSTLNDLESDARGFDAIFASVTDGSKDKPCTVTVRGQAYTVESGGFRAGLRRPDFPSKVLKADVAAVLNACKVSVEAK